MSRHRSTRFAVSDYARLQDRFEHKPVTVLLHFRAVGIGSLMELEMYARLKEREPQKAKWIAAIADLMGIPEELNHG